MSSLRFEWDEAKDRANQSKHGIGFDEASRVFDDPLHLSILERVRNGEERWLTFGTVANLSVLVLADTIRKLKEDEEVIELVRIISAREATRAERRFYEEETS
jgi:hypothetical protein